MNERVLDLATQRAADIHFAEQVSPSSGHDSIFLTCSHPDCQAVRVEARVGSVLRQHSWQPIEQPPELEGMHSRRYLGVLADGLHVFCQYTPFYLGHPEEAKSLWVCEGFSWSMKPTHWMPLPEPPLSTVVADEKENHDSRTRVAR